jgi:amino-acid N-acetyltransferase
MNVLNANATKRDAKQYLARFKKSKEKLPISPTLSPLQEERNARHRRDQDRLDRIGVNLGGLYAPARAIAETPQFIRDDIETVAALPQQTLHVALVCLRMPEILDDATLDGVALTLSQLVKLDMRILVVLACGTDSNSNLKETKRSFAEQADHLIQAIARHSPDGAQVVNGAIEILQERSEIGHGKATTKASVGIPNLLLDPLKRSVIPVVPTLAHTTSGQLVPTSASSIMSALCVILSGSHIQPAPKADLVSNIDTSLDRIIVLDSAGGIPSKARGDEAHVFINLEQEFDDIEAELSEYASQSIAHDTKGNSGNVYDQHRSNLSMVCDCLAMLPSASSALIITPEEAASSSLSPPVDDSTIGAGTRRRKNSLIHNLLTNKPAVSSSLPPARMRSSTEPSEASPVDTSSATLVKRGMPLKIIPAADKRLGWQFPANGKTSLSLEDDPQVDLPRLVHLIEDSFRRKLDVRDYLNRIQGRIAGLIIAGEYEGGAILTWEMPPGTNDPARLVPYLDKFAVLSSCQGSSGVADIVFQSMVRTCFPNGVCWRSRKDNPVNKWYFERSDGTWQIPNTNWTMFWTGGGVVEDEQRWRDYVGVCRDVQPSWADGKKPD